MIKALQKKFIMTAMIAITILLAAITAAINGFNLVLTLQNEDALLEMLSDNAGMPQFADGRPVPAEVARSADVGSKETDETGSGSGAPDAEADHSDADAAVPAVPTYTSGMTEDDVRSVRFFVIRFDPEDNIFYSDVSRISSVSLDEARSLARDALKSGKKNGNHDSFVYRVSSQQESRTVVFMDVSGDRRELGSIALISAVTFALGWAAMLILVILLSRRAIRPIAENIERQKQFITNAGHEIKTPLAIIQTNTEAVELFTGRTKWTANIKDQVKRLNGLVQNMLVLSRMDENSLQPVREEFMLDDLIRETLKPFQESIRGKNLTLTQELSPQTAVRADRAALTQLFSILFDNAVKYTPEGGFLRCRLEKNGRKVVFTQENSLEKGGQRIPAEKLFERFYRGDSARTQKNGGYGIGLSAARSMARMNGGTLRAEYPDEETIRFTLKL